MPIPNAPERKSLSLRLGSLLRESLKLIGIALGCLVAFSVIFFCLGKERNCNSLALDGTVLLDGLPDLVRLRTIQTAPSTTKILDYLLGSPGYSRAWIHR